MNFLLNEIVKFYDIENDATEYDWADTKLLQESFLAIVEKQYAGRGSFVLSGCEVDATNSTSASISAGLVYLDILNNSTTPPTAEGKIFKFGGVSGWDAEASPVYYLSANVTEDGKWINRNLTQGTTDPGSVAKIQFVAGGVLNDPHSPQLSVTNISVGDGFDGFARIERFGKMRVFTCQFTRVGESLPYGEAWTYILENRDQNDKEVRLRTHAVNSSTYSTYSSVISKTTDNSIIAIPDAGGNTFLQNLFIGGQIVWFVD